MPVLAAPLAALAPGVCPEARAKAESKAKTPVYRRAAVHFDSVSATLRHAKHPLPLRTFGCSLVRREKAAKQLETGASEYGWVMRIRYQPGAVAGKRK